MGRDAKLHTWEDLSDLHMSEACKTVFEKLRENLDLSVVRAGNKKEKLPLFVSNGAIDGSIVWEFKVERKDHGAT